MRPILSDSVAQNRRPPMLNSDNRPVNPAPTAAIIAQLGRAETASEVPG